MDILLALTGPFVGFLGASVFAVLFLALLLGTAAASVFVAIFLRSQPLSQSRRPYLARSVFT
jgi:hypothetical protein